MLSGIILYMHPANERWVHTDNDPCVIECFNHIPILDTSHWNQISGYYLAKRWATQVEVGITAEECQVICEGTPQCNSINYESSTYLCVLNSIKWGDEQSAMDLTLHVARDYYYYCKRGRF